MPGYRLRVAVEDRFIVFSLAEQKNTLPGVNLSEWIAGAISERLPDYHVILDYRGLNMFTNDVNEFVDSFSDYKPTLLVEPGYVSEFKEAYPGRQILGAECSKLPLNYSDLPIEHWDQMQSPGVLVSSLKFDSAVLQARILSEQDNKYKEVMEEWYHGRYDKPSEWMSDHGEFEDIVLSQKIIELARNSLLISHTLNLDHVNGPWKVTPYHSGAVYGAEERDGVILARPGVLAKNVSLILSHQLNGFERIINEYKHETEITDYINNNPDILKVLGYKKIYPQIILERDEPLGNLKPDFILEPLTGGWCDILECKLPEVVIDVGVEDRKTFSAKVHAMLAQLREYAAYFEDPKLAKRIEDVYGIKCYRPKMIGLVGNRPIGTDDREMRRLETVYSDSKVISFNDLHHILAQRLLI